MVNIYGVVNTKKGRQYIKVAETDIPLTVFPEFSFENTQMFNGKWKKEDNEIYYINLINDMDIISEFKNTLQSSVDVNVINKENFSNLNCLFVSDNKNNIKFQRIYNRYFFKKSFLNFSDSSVCKINNNQEIITLTGKIDAYWNDAEKKLYFNDFRVIKSIFLQIDKFYREATQTDINNFSRISILDVKDFNYGSRARKKIAEMLDDNIFDGKTINELKTYADKYQQPFPKIYNEKIKLENNKDIESIYQIVNQLFYTTDLTQEKRKTNSSKPI